MKNKGNSKPAGTTAVKSGREEKEDVFQAVLLSDNFGSSIFGPSWADKRYPIKNSFDDEGDAEEGSDARDSSGIDQRLSQESLIPLVNRKLLDYSLEALTVSGVQEIFIYCSSGVKGGNAIKDHLKKSRWDDLNVKITVISSDDCESLGDALRDLDGKGIVRNDFILMNPGVVTNVALRPLLDEHRETMKEDKGAVVTLVHRKLPTGHRSRSANENSAIVIDQKSRKVIAYSHKIHGQRLKIPMESLTKDMEVILDSVSSGIAVCSASVLPLFTDNFDFKNISDFIKNILMNEEVMGNTIYLHQIKCGYATKIVDFDTYLGVSLDILQRWSYPLVPDMPFGSNPGDFVHQMGINFVYKVSNVRTARDATIGPGVVIGNGSTVGKGTKVKSSSIGKQCTIGDNCSILDSQIGDRVIIENGCNIHQCVVLDDSHIHKAQAIQPKSLVVLKHVFPIDILYESESDSESEDDEDPEPAHASDGDFKRFCAEVLESLQRGYTDNVALDNLFVEIQGSRTANFMYFDDATVAVIKGILGLAPKIDPEFFQLKLVSQWNKTKEIVVRYTDLLKLYVKNDAGQDNLLKTIEEYANDNQYFRALTMQLLHYYFNEDVLSQENIMKWYSKESLYEAGKEIRKSAQKFIEWLETASEEESDDE